VKKKDYIVSKIVQKMRTNSLLKQIVKKHKKEYLEVAFTNTGLCNGIIDAVCLATWKEDTRLKDWQIYRSLKHLRHGLGEKVSVSFLQNSKGQIGPPSDLS